MAGAERGRVRSLNGRVDSSHFNDYFWLRACTLTSITNKVYLNRVTSRSLPNLLVGNKILPGCIGAALSETFLMPQHLSCLHSTSQSHLNFPICILSVSTPLPLPLTRNYRLSPKLFLFLQLPPELYSNVAAKRRERKFQDSVAQLAQIVHNSLAPFFTSYSTLGSGNQMDPQEDIKRRTKNLVKCNSREEYFKFAARKLELRCLWSTNRA